ncbi:hypothetical protein PILCRDRAFT_651470 [Piloderma croceum F 1598]|uniref:Uncharacterized protein n=1 Tax=Piloderma croceum (strain F 1598) TaxID=765440 RepID=A0A0C3F9D6_PILCF|nr:hypothetical protein PILCRDRAFT_651470 [Piloderma croceum F 1598]
MMKTFAIQFQHPVVFIHPIKHDFSNILCSDPFRFRDSGNRPTKSTPMVCHGRVGTSSGTGIAESLDISIHRFPPDIVSETAIPNVDVSDPLKALMVCINSKLYTNQIVLLRQIKFS